MTDNLKKKVEKAKHSKVEELQKQLEEITEMGKRTMADLQNLKRRQEEEKGMWIKMANAELISALLPILDNLNLATKHIPKNASENTKKWLEGIEMSIKKCKDTFEESGLTPIKSEGQPFNPDLHEALMQEPGEKNIVTEELEKGYMLGNKVLRHAKVKVGNGEKA